jgi:23S rRNA (cytidine1920-2'-O)/16S rRNA (cytidine1409-2'-O)-methyltransferase
MKEKVVKNRLDKEIVQRGLVPSREKARALIMAGDVLVDDQVEDKAGKIVTAANRIELREKFPYVSRGALKIEKALNDFSLPVKGLKILDIGISTGGFSDYMLKNGADEVTGVDVNIRQVDDSLKRHPRLKLIQANARYGEDLAAEKIGFEPDLVTIDVSFISLTKILPAISQFGRAKIVALVKPQFEAPRGNVGKGGVIRKEEKRLDILLNLKRQIISLEYGVTGFTLAGIKGKKGNQEYFFLLEYGKNTSISDKIVAHGIETEL